MDFLSMTYLHLSLYHQHFWHNTEKNKNKNIRVSQAEPHSGCGFFIVYFFRRGGMVGLYNIKRLFFLCFFFPFLSLGFNALHFFEKIPFTRGLVNLSLYLHLHLIGEGAEGRIVFSQTKICPLDGKA